MSATVIISGLTVIAVFLCLLFDWEISLKKLKIKAYWLCAVIGAVMLVCFGFVSFADIKADFFSNTPMNPLKLLAVFFSMTFLSVYLDELGFFRLLANLCLKRAKASPKKLFLYLYLIVSALTVFTSNDVVILTFTPFIIYFSKNAKINPLPYLMAEFVAANTLSMVLIIGNPTNIFLATSFNIGFLDYFKIMLLPSLMAATAGFFLLAFVFRKHLKQPIQAQTEHVEIKSRFLLITGLLHLVLCVILLAVSSYINLDMWLICLCFSLSLLIFILCYALIKRKKPDTFYRSVKRLPYQLIPFVVSMFIIVLAVEKTGLTQTIADLFGGKSPVFVYGLTSFFSANILNNIPMSVFYGNILSCVNQDILYRSVFASVIGSNIGAYLTPVGALAGIMWLNILKHCGVNFSFGKFIKYGVIIALPILLVSLFGLHLSSLMFLI